MLLVSSLQLARAMRWLLLVGLLACSHEDVQRPSLEGPHACGPSACTTGQVCVIVESGSQCGVNADAGIGQYQEYSWTCVDLPKACDGIPSCDCVPGGGLCFGADGRDVHYGCI